MANNRKNETLSSIMKGDKGEDIAYSFIINKGFNVICRNYEKYWGELDIIAEKDNVLHFFEVKSVTYTPLNDKNGHKPEDNVDGFKVRQIRRMIMTYLEESKRGFDFEFRFHIICVYMNMKNRRARVRWIENLVI